MSIYRAAFAKRRELLLNKLDSGAVVVLRSGSEKNRNSDVFYKFRPNSDFLYFTGFKEPNAIAVFTKGSYVMYLQEKDETQEMWHGARLGTKEAVKTLGVDAALPNTLWSAPENTDEDFSKEIAELRLIKSRDEIIMMQWSADIAVDAHKDAMAKVVFRGEENHLQARFDSKFTFNKVEHSYPPIVASGKNALCLHYTENNSRLLPGDLVLIDAGCEMEGYASDITRTFPVDGKFTDEQAELYQIVLDANKAAIRLAHPGVHFRYLDDMARRVITDGLKGLGYDVSDSRRYFPHGTSHWLGLDVHDVGERDVVLAPGMALTVEPGIYIKEKGIGIRIEDNIIITDNGHINLTKALPKEIKDIEDLILQ